MKLIVGLGNPGEKYKKTRHNLGFLVVEQFLKDFEVVNKTIWKDEPKFKSEIAQLEWQPKHGKLEKIILAKPKTYMNNSGLAVSLISTFYKLPITDIWIIHDDLDLPLCSMKVRLGGAAGGHHGVESILESLKTDKFWRFRLGIGNPRTNLKLESKHLKLKGVDDYVLSNFTGGDWGKARELIKRGSDAIQTALEEGLEKAMNKFNTK